MGPILNERDLTDEAYQLTNQMLAMMLMPGLNSLDKPNCFSIANRYKYQLYMHVREMLLQDIYESF
jgi:hypothetical protein